MHVWCLFYIYKDILCSYTGPLVGGEFISTSFASIACLSILSRHIYSHTITIILIACLGVGASKAHTHMGHPLNCSHTLIH